MYAAMLAAPERAAGTTSPPARCAPPAALRCRWRSCTPSRPPSTAPILEGYGLSETSPVASFNHPDRARKAGSIGTPIEGVEMRVIDDEGREVPVGEVGEIAIRGHNIMKGYWRPPRGHRRGHPRTAGSAPATSASVDEDGYYFIVDRKKDLIIRGGFNVYPREIEEILYEHPAVAEAAVIGIPHPSLGQEIGAAVALKPGRQATPEELREFVKGAGGPVQVPAPGLDRRRAAQDGDRQDPQAGDPTPDDPDTR